MLNYFLERNGKGSLLNYLRQKLWAADLNAVFYDPMIKFNMIFYPLSIGINLTENGFDRLDDVLTAVFSYLKFFQSAKLDASNFLELRTAQMYFARFFKDAEALDNVHAFLYNMIRYPSEYIVLAPGNMFDYDDAVNGRPSITYANSI